MPVSAPHGQSTKERTMTISHPERLKDVHPDLVGVVERLGELNDIVILCGARSAADQKANVAKGVSGTTHSRHVIKNNHCGFACAVDMAPLLEDGSIPWKRWDMFDALNRQVQQIAAQHRVPVTWGGTWHHPKDGDHWQLPWDVYP